MPVRPSTPISDPTPARRHDDVQVRGAAADLEAVSRLTAGAVALGVVALVTGVAALLGAPAGLALVAGGAGAVAAGIAVVVGARMRAAEWRAREAEEAADQTRRTLRLTEEALEDAEARLEWRMSFTSRRRSTETDRLTDGVTGLLAEGWFVVALESRIAAARRHLRPVAVVVLEVVSGLDDGAPVAVDPRRVSAALTATIREADEAFRLRDGVFALLLEDTTDTGATWSAERVRLAIGQIEPEAVMWAGVACYPAHGLTTEEVLDRADTALDAAREWRQHRIEVATTES
jgi:GGDEF domain-containing protein